MIGVVTDYLFATSGNNLSPTKKQGAPSIMNIWKTSDIKISTDSVGCITAEHKYAGKLLDNCFYESRAEARRDAVEVLKEMKELAACDQSEW
tara:strand:- start:183 stop:458 length:276 start_codon:yes stop_codon:yes gene_type:complete